MKRSIQIVGMRIVSVKTLIIMHLLELNWNERNTKMNFVKYIGYWGNADDKAENEAMGLVPGKLYSIHKWVPCCEDDPTSTCGALLPMVNNESGKQIQLVHGEFKEV